MKWPSALIFLGVVFEECSWGLCWGDASWCCHSNCFCYSCAWTLHPNHAGTLRIICNVKKKTTKNEILPLLLCLVRSRHTAPCLMCLCREGAFFTGEDSYLNISWILEIIRHNERLYFCLCLVFFNILSPNTLLVHRFIVSSSYTDMPIFGQCPAQDDFYLVMCGQCGQVVKPQAFQAHYGTFQTLVVFILTTFKVVRVSHPIRDESAIEESTHSFSATEVWCDDAADTSHINKSLKVSLRFGIPPGLLHTETWEGTAKHSQMQSNLTRA